jgi:GWxTD domain-containing protein
MPVVTAALLTVTVVTAMAALQLGSGTHQNAPVQPSAHPPAAIVSERVAPRAALPEKVLLAQAQTPGRQPAPPPTGQVQPDQILYDRAVQNIDHGNYVAARLTLNTLINTYSGSSLLPKAKLAIADSWFREGGTRGRAQAEIEYKDFILFYPNSPEANEAQAKLDSIATKQNEPDIYRKRMDKEVGHIISDEERKAFQTAIAQQNEVSRPLTAEQQRAKEDVLRNGLLTPYRKWLDQDVVYIISDEERKAFTNLRTDEEREKFVQQFWARRDPTPGTERNEFKEEIYRRIAYTNAHFSASVAGWRTDRGRIYIQYGPPDEIEAHSTGGVYQRPASEGGGTTQTYPFEQWRYRLIDGVGQNVILEFVDKDGSGDYKMTMDPKEKDNLLRAPGGSPR